MKKSELKSIIKPIVEECVRDVLFKEGVLSSIVSEVMLGVTGQQTITENKSPKPSVTPVSPVSSRKSDLRRNKKKLMDEIGRDTFGGVDLFEGTTPAPAARGASPAHGALKDRDPNDPGVNIDGLMGIMGNTWKILAKGK
tara:strand:+ start:321 stop:740 length:420 start_codon:yes stop_codon:yes gene_type:complete